MQSVFVLLAILFSSTAIACGDSLYRVGSGVSYRNYVAPLPGNLLVSGQLPGAEQLASRLSDAGHTVRIVTSADELAALSASPEYDVVIAGLDEQQAITSTSDISFLAVTESKEEQKRARETNVTAMVPGKHEIKHYLKAIHLALTDKA